MGSYESPILVVKYRGAPAPLWRSVIAAHQDRQVSYVSPSIPDQGVNLDFIEPLQSLFVWVLR